MNTIRNKRLGRALCIVAAFCALSCIGCVWTMQSATGKQLSGNGNMTVKTFELKDFDAVAVGGSWRVNISQSETFSVKIEADENLFEYFDIAVSGKTLRIGTKHGYSIQSTKCSAVITMPTLMGLDCAGAMRVAVSSFKRSDEALSVTLSGSGSITACDMTVKELKLEISGSGTVTPTGKAQKMTAA